MERIHTAGRRGRGVRTTRLRRPRSAPFVKSASASIAPRPNVRDDGQRPSFEAGWRTYATDLGRRERKMFFRTRLDRANQIETARQIRVCAQRAGAFLRAGDRPVSRPTMALLSDELLAAAPARSVR